jgi:hypothetical protein
MEALQLGTAKLPHHNRLLFGLHPLGGCLDA